MNPADENGASARYEEPCANGDGNVPVVEKDTKTPVDGLNEIVGEEEYPVPLVMIFTSTISPF